MKKWTNKTIEKTFKTMSENPQDQIIKAALNYLDEIMKQPESTYNLVKFSFQDSELNIKLIESTIKLIEYLYDICKNVLKKETKESVQLHLKTLKEFIEQITNVNDRQKELFLSLLISEFDSREIDYKKFIGKEE